MELSHGHKRFTKILFACASQYITDATHASSVQMCNAHELLYWICSHYFSETVLQSNKILCSSFMQITFQCMTLIHSNNTLTWSLNWNDRHIFFSHSNDWPHHWNVCTFISNNINKNILHTYIKTPHNFDIKKISLSNDFLWKINIFLFLYD